MSTYRRFFSALGGFVWIRGQSLYEPSFACISTSRGQVRICKSEQIKGTIWCPISQISVNRKRGSVLLDIFPWTPIIFFRVLIQMILSGTIANYNVEYRNLPPDWKQNFCCNLFSLLTFAISKTYHSYCMFSSHFYQLNGISCSWSLEQSPVTKLLRNLKYSITFVIFTHVNDAINDILIIKCLNRSNYFQNTFLSTFLASDHVCFREFFLFHYSSHSLN